MKQKRKYNSATVKRWLVAPALVGAALLMHACSTTEEFDPVTGNLTKKTTSFDLGVQEINVGGPNGATVKFKKTDGTTQATGSGSTVEEATKNAAENAGGSVDSNGDVTHDGADTGFNAETNQVSNTSTATDYVQSYWYEGE